MSITNYTKKNTEIKEVNEKKHISYEERIKIETLIKESYSIKDINKHLKRPIRTIQNEIATKKVTILSKNCCRECKYNLDCQKIEECPSKEFKSNCGKRCRNKCKQNNCKAFKRMIKCINSNNCNTCNNCKLENTCNKTKIFYFANTAQNIYEKNRRNCKQELKISKIKGLSEYIKNNIIKNKYSPDAIIGRLKNTVNSFENTISTSTLYSYINNGLISGVSNLDLKLKCRYKVKKEYVKSTGKNNHRINREIDTRTGEENIPTHIGHYELDLVEGIKGHSLLLTFIDRFTSELFIQKIASKEQENVHNALVNINNILTKKYGINTIKSITTDNGSEFKNFSEIEKVCNCKLFYTLPYSSWQKGKIEQANWTIRTYIQKGIDIDKYSEEKILKIQDTINNMPRKKFKYLTALEFYEKNVSKIE